MSQSEMILYAVKLILGGITALAAVMLYSKTKDGAWISLIAGFVSLYVNSEALIKKNICTVFIILRQIWVSKVC